MRQNWGICPLCANERELCYAHQQSDIEYEKLDRGDRDRCDDPAFQKLLAIHGGR